MLSEHKNSPSDKIRGARNVVKSTIIFSSCRMISIHGIQLLHQVGLRCEAIGCI